MNDKNNDITSTKVKTAAPSSYRGAFEHNIEPNNIWGILWSPIECILCWRLGHNYSVAEN